MKVAVVNWSSKWLCTGLHLSYLGEERLQVDALPAEPLSASLEVGWVHSVSVLESHDGEKLGGSLWNDMVGRGMEGGKGTGEL